MSGRSRGLFRLPWRSRREIGREIDQELAFHLEMRVSELTEQGIPPELARARAREEFGDLELTRQYCRTLDQRTERAERATARLYDWRLDLRSAIRALRRSPGFTVVSLVTLALAIGANTAIFSVARAVLLAPLPYGDPGSLVGVFESWPGQPEERVSFSPPNFVDYRARTTALAGVAAIQWRDPVTWEPDGGDPTAVPTVAVSPTLLGVLRVAPGQGTGFGTASDTLRAEAEVMVSHRFWAGSMGADPRAVGRSLRLEGRSYRVTGVLPDRFRLQWDADLYLPLDLTEALADAPRTRKQHYLTVIGRLAPGTSVAAARSDLAGIAQELEREYPEANTDRHAIVLPLRDAVAGDLRRPLVLMQAAAALVLLIACANLANVTLARATGRRREVALRAALGAGRGRLVRQLLTESLLLGVLGGILGLGLARLAGPAVLALDRDLLPPLFEQRVDGGVLLFSLGVTLLASILFGLAPAVQAARADLRGALQEGGRGQSGGPGGERARRALVVAQVGITVMLLVGAGLLVRSFAALTRESLGFEPGRVLTGRVTLGGERYQPGAARNRFFDEAFARLARTPGVVAAGAAYPIPMQGSLSTAVRVEGQPVDETNLPGLGFVAVAGDYFAALGIPVLAGRTYDETDRPDGPKTAVINEAAARRFFPAGDAVGRRVRIGPDPEGPWITVIGVVGDIRDEGWGAEPKPTLFANHRQESWIQAMTLVVKTTGRPEGLTPALRDAVREADPLIAVSDVKSLDAVVGARLATRRFGLGLSAGFAALALVLAAVGLYGVLAYGVSLRAREFGIRRALGATPEGIVSLVLRQGLGWSLLGLGLGVGGSLVTGRLLAGVLYGVGPFDPLTYAGVTGAILITIAAACVAPAARATRADPLASLRAE